MARIFDQVLPLSQVSLQPPASFPELYQELWWYSGGYIAQSSVPSASGNSLIAKGTTGLYAYTNSQTKLHTFSANWPATTKCAFEATLWNSAANTAYAELWDITSNTAVSGSQISSTSTTATVIRSAQFTLTPGHTYGVAIWESSTSPSIYITDASLIIFPPAGSVSPSLSSISLANPSGGTLKEAYIPLWVFSSSYAQSTATSAGATGSLLQKGVTTLAGSASSNTPSQLHNHSSSWSPTQQFAFEASIYNVTASDVAYVAMWDFTAGAVVSVSQISVTTTTSTLIRSGQFTLVPSHVYGVTLWCNAGTARISKAHLVALGG